MTQELIGFDFEPVQGQRLVHALGSAPLSCDDGSVSYDTILLWLENCSLLFSVNEDTDEVICKLTQKIGSSLSDNVARVNVGSLDKYVGLEIGWLWVARNWLGYADTMSISFAGINPSFTMIGVAAKLNLYQLNKL